MGHALLAVLDADVDECETDLEALAPFESVMPTQMVWQRAACSVSSLTRSARNAAHGITSSKHWRFVERAGSSPSSPGPVTIMPPRSWTVGARDDRVKAAALLDEGEQIATALGLVPLRKRISAFRERYRLRLARNPAGLTTREFEVLQLLASGKANKDIAEALFISTHTVAVHVARVLEKTGSSNRTAAVAYATRHHLLESTRSGTADERRPKNS